MAVHVAVRFAFRHCFASVAHRGGVGRWSTCKRGRRVVDRLAHAAATGHDQCVEEIDERSGTSSLTLLRRATAALIVLAAAALALVAPRLESFETCTTRSTRTVDASVEEEEPQPSLERWRECKVADATVALPLLVVGLLLYMPDVTELAIPGLVSLKRQVNSQEKQVQMQADRQNALEQQITSFHAAFMRQETSVTTNVLVSDLSQTAARVENKAPAWVEARAVSRADLEESEPQPSEHEARLESELLRASAALEMFLKDAYAPLEMAVSGQRREMIQRWHRLFRREIEVVQAARNAIASPPYDLTADDLLEATQIANRLIGLLETRLAGIEG